MNSHLFFLGQAQQHPLRTLNARRAPVVRGFLITAAVFKQIASLLWATVQFLGFGLNVVLLLILANTLLESELAVWASLFILSASRGVFASAFHDRPSLARNTSSFDEAVYAATLIALADDERRRKAQGGLRRSCEATPLTLRLYAVLRRRDLGHHAIPRRPPLCNRLRWDAAQGIGHELQVIDLPHLGRIGLLFARQGVVFRHHP